MLSLREKLKNAEIKERKSPPAEKRAEDCFRKTETVGIPDGLPEALSASALRLMTGRDLPALAREEILFLDTETTGLSGGAGTVAFLIGAGFYRGGAFAIEQYLLRDYDEELFQLQHISELLAGAKALCTFNGASFDVPLLRSRLVMNRIRPQIPDIHIDLVHIARRVWKTRLEHCDLQTLERSILHEEREDDLPGSLVPQRYFSYLKCRDQNLLTDILKHNAADIASLPRLLRRLSELHEDPMTADAPEDLFSLGRILEKRGDRDRAKNCYRASEQSAMAFAAKLRLAEISRREGDYPGAVQSLESALRRRNRWEVHRTLAILYEYRLKRYPDALRHARKMMELAGEESGKREEAGRRCARIEKRMKSGTEREDA